LTADFPAIKENPIARFNAHAERRHRTVYGNAAGADEVFHVAP
jgi:hypothetical protein